jgi:hypothetical protein
MMIDNLERVLDHLDVETGDGDHVEAHVDAVNLTGSQPGGRETAEALLLHATNRGRGGTEAVGATGLDLADDEQVAAASDQIDLADGTAPVAVDDGEAVVGVPRGGELLALPAAFEMG